MTQLARDYRESNRELVESFRCRAISRGWSEHTQRAYALTVDWFVEFFGSRSIVSASRADVHLFLEKLMKRGMTSISVNRHIHVLRSFFKFLRLAGLIMRDPMLQVSDRKVPKQVRRVLTIEEVEKLIAAGRNPFEVAVIEVFYGTGIRISELCALRLEDIDFASDPAIVKIVRGKGGKDRYSLFGGPARKAISEYLAWGKPTKFLFELPRHIGELMPLPQGWGARVYIDGVQRYFHIGKRRDFPTEQDARAAMDKITAKLPGFHLGGGCPCKARAIRNLLKRLGERAGIGHVHPHMLRRAPACHMLSHGAGIREVQVFLGHERITTTQLYTHLTIEDLKKIHERCHPHEQGNRTAEER